MSDVKIDGMLMMSREFIAFPRLAAPRKVRVRQRFESTSSFRDLPISRGWEGLMATKELSALNADPGQKRTFES